MSSREDHLRWWRQMVRASVTGQAATGPVIGAVPEPAVGILRRFTDAKAVNGTIESADGAFAFIAAKVAEQSGTTSLEWLHQRFFIRVLRLWHDDGSRAETLLQASRRPDFPAEMAALDEWLEHRSDGTDAAKRPELAVLLDSANALSQDEWRSLVGGSPRLSQIPVEHIQADVSVLGKHPSTLPDYLDDVVLYQNLAKDLLEAAQAADPEFDLCVRARLDVALDLVERRRFAKLRMLELGWPELMERVLMPGGVRRLRQFEAYVLGDADAEAPAEAWTRFLDDEHLKEFLRTRPHFRAINDGFLAYAAGTADRPARPQPEPEPELELEEGNRYRDAELTLKDGPDEYQETWKGTAVLRTAQGDLQWAVTIKVKELTDAANDFSRIYMGVSSSGSRTGPVMRDYSVVNPENPTVMTEKLGLALWDQTFGAKAEAADVLLDLLAKHQRVRLTVASNNNAVVDLQWECLRIPKLRVTVGLTLKLSVVRKVADPVSLSSHTIGAPLRVLQVLAEPDGLPPLPGARQELQLLRESFAEAEHQQTAILQTIPKATERALRERLRRFRPHVLHYIGHAMVDRHTGTAALILSDTNGRRFDLTAEKLAVQLQDSGVVLAVLNGCMTGVNPGTDEFAFGLCQSIVRQGVPAVVATVRDVDDTAALRFAQEFYQAFIDGHPLEECVAEARKGVFMQGWDWSAWVTFASEMADLQSIRLRLPVRG
ncbi:CHAT domain-containing protein [Plantactinospora sp. S1510]|uniref:CHAT domain-containing protein n=1 Tax=Plantactinospora alkalitolerans TaxID=2789879 RepID=A0ABS0H2P3_9ACTN|nr:CHAT domain-containing protein [Plantactinospora alkalitolerans]MBF9132737.1 CHAT domain-containing protein [Plantactinospora alkalitolerans]